MDRQPAIDDDAMLVCYHRLVADEEFSLLFVTRLACWFERTMSIWQAAGGLRQCLVLASLNRNTCKALTALKTWQLQLQYVQV
jgi:hypothetical protein